MNNKKIARLAACKLKGHMIDSDMLCVSCFADFWSKHPISTPMEATKKAFIKKMEVLDC